jgi:hypothetical protein
LRERVAQLEETVAEQHHSSESPEQPTASRRGLLSAAAGVAGLGALGVYSSSPASAQAAGQVGTQSEPVDVEAYDVNVQGSLTGVNTGDVQNPLTGDLDAGGNSVTNAAAVEADDGRINDSVGYSGYPTEGGVALYVRNSGSDSNTGLSTTDAVATVGAALDRLPRLPVYNGAKPSAVIELKGGETYQISDEVIQAPWVSKLLIDTDDGTTATLQVPNGSNGFLVKKTTAGFTDIRIEPSDSANVHDAAIQARRQAVINIRDGTTLFDGSGGLGDGLVEAYDESFVQVRSGATVDANGSGANGVVSHSSSHLAINGTVQNSDRAVYADRGATASVIGATVDNNSYVSYAEDGGLTKLVGVNLSGNNTVLYAGAEGVAKIESISSQTGTTTLENGRSGGITIDQRSNDWTMWGQNGQPMLRRGGNGVYPYIDRIFNATASDLDEYQMAFDPNGPHLVYKTGAGTAYKISTDGQI